MPVRHTRVAASVEKPKSISPRRPAARRVAVATPPSSKPLKEERVQNQDENNTRPQRQPLPLKNDQGEMPVDWARLLAFKLDELLRSDADQFAALKALVEGRPQDVSKAHERALRKKAFITTAGDLLPNLERVMRASYKETLNGPVIEDPVEVRSLKHGIQLVDAEDGMTQAVEKGLASFASKYQWKKTNGSDGPAR